ncbi:MAG: hypothetical protein AAGC60_15995 [Acidobacteriota bacterium]
MPRTIVVERDGAVSSFKFRKIDRARLYGQKRRIHLDPSGAACTRAALTEDGSLILRAGMTAQGYFDEDGQWLRYGELVGLDADGEALEKVPSTLGEAVALEGPVAPRELLDCRVQSVYSLDPEELDEALAASLREGAIYRLPFVYRSDYHQGRAFLVANPAGELFALVVDPAPPDWSEPHVLPAYDDEDDGFDDELDFEMFG